MNQVFKKVIVSVPEMPYSSFKTDLIKHGFLLTGLSIIGTIPVSMAVKAVRLKHLSVLFMGDDQVLVCTHATLRFAFDKIEPQAFNNTLVAIDEFHHVSADENSRLGGLIDVLMKQSTAHIVAVTRAPIFVVIHFQF